MLAGEIWGRKARRVRVELILSGSFASLRMTARTKHKQQEQQQQPQPQIATAINTNKLR
jgi:hypothetical protein